MSSDAVVVPVVAACIVQGKSVLLSKRLTAREPSTLGKWEFPGGVVDLGEDLRDALKREIHEELGLRIDPLSVLHVQVNTYESGTNYLVMFYECVLTAEWDITPFRGNLIWVNPQGVIKGRQDVLPGTIEAIERLLGRHGFSFLKNSATEQTVSETLRILTYEVGDMNKVFLHSERYGKTGYLSSFKLKAGSAISMLRMICEHMEWDFEEVMGIGEKRYLARQLDLEKHAVTPRLKVKDVKDGEALE